MPQGYLYLFANDYVVCWKARGHSKESLLLESEVNIEYLQNDHVNPLGTFASIYRNLI